MAFLFSRMVSFYILAVLLALCADPVLSAPGPPGGGHGGNSGNQCKKIHKRKEWRDMPIPQRKAWAQAVLCLNSKPATSTYGGGTTRFDQFAATHVQLFEFIHRNGQFLPWHRHIVTLFDNALRDECGYRGPTPYWDWTRDADAPGPISDSPIFHPVHGLGGDGVPGTYDPPTGGLHQPWSAKGCIDSGPHKDMIVGVGPGTINDPHCIARGFNESAWRPFMTSAAVDQVLLLAQDFEAFIEIIDRDFAGIHGGGHGYVGGDMMDGSAPVDPLFYLHHAQLDRVWWQWQRANPSQRLYDMGGPTLAFPAPNNITTTLDDVMLFTGLGPDITVRDAMDASAYPYCFSY